MNKLIVIMATLLAAGCAREIPAPSVPPEDLDPVAQAVRALTGARTRVIWLQDMGDGADYLARGANLQLMGYDTDDGRGPRTLLPAGRNMAKPMFTVDGERIVFSDRHAGTMHLVHWEGGETETLGEGFVLHTWRDTQTGIEWLFYAKDLVDDGKILPTHEAIYRKALRPAPRSRHTLYNGLRGRLGERRVWTQSHVSEDSYQLSADGRFASAAFPWPEVGVHDIGGRRWNRHGRGCWVAMAPDNSYLFWIFDGPHRNLTMEQVGGPAGGRWTVPINHLPETDRYEVYHPRWSNHPRIMAVSGPYKIGEGAYRLPGGGADVEIWLGRFSEDHRSIEHWVRLTYNNHANFYPDVWVEPDPRKPSFEQAAAIPPLKPQQLSWPVNDQALLYRWEHGAAQNEVTDAQSGRIQIFRPEPRQRARYGARHEMWLEGGYFLDENAPRIGHSFTLECIAHSPQPVEGYAPLVSFSADVGLFEVDGRWVFREANREWALGEALHGEDAHIVFSASPDRVQFYLNGDLKADIHLVAPIALSPAQHLFYGGHPDHPADWPGRMSHIALYGRALDEREAAQHYRLLREELGRHTPDEVDHVRARVVEQSAIPTPQDIAPYRRGLVVNEYEIIDGARAGERLLAAHWAILDEVVLETADRPVNSEYTLSLTLFDERPELEGERVAMDSEDFTLELWYDLNL